MNSLFFSDIEIYNYIKKFEDELITVYYQILSRCGNRYEKDVLQDVYLKCCSIFLNAHIQLYEFKAQVISVTEETCWEYLAEERNNAARARGFGAIGKSESGGWGEMGADFQWEVIPDFTGNAEHKMVAIDELKSIKDYKGQWMPYRYAIQYVHLLELRSEQDWINYCRSKKRLHNIPDNPNEVYPQFESWDKFLGIRYFKYDDCCNWVKNNVFAKNKEQWNDNLTGLPKQVPLYPNDIYLNKGWTNWDDFLGVNTDIGVKYRTYKEAQLWVEENLWSLNLNQSTWDEYLKGSFEAPTLPLDIPNNPDVVYKQVGWVTWYRWFGGQSLINRKYPFTYSQCSKWIKKNAPMVKTKDHWLKFINGGFYIKKPDYIPERPDQIYKNGGWHGWYSFLNESRSTPNGIFDSLTTKEIRILYDGEKIWVQPLSATYDYITGKVVTVLCNIGQGSVIKFGYGDVISSIGVGNKKTQTKIQKDRGYIRNN